MASESTSSPNLLEQSRALWDKLPTSRRWLAILALLAVVGAAGWASLSRPSENYQVLFAGLGPEDAQRTLEYLKAQNVLYRTPTTGTIEVPAEKVYELRIGVAATVLPRGGGGAGYELFDKQSFGSTSFVEKLNYRRALEGELSRTVGSIDGVSRARVHLAIQEAALFREEQKPPTASVVVQMRPGRRLSPSSIKGVVQLVAGSVEGLVPDHVVLVDDSGVKISTGGDELAGLDRQQQLEKALAQKVTDIMDRVVGPGHSAVSVTAEFDDEQIERTEDLYDGLKTAVISETSTQTKKTDAEGDGGGVAGAQGNLAGTTPPANAAAAADAAATTFAEQKSTKNYQPSHVITHNIGARTRIKRLQVAVVVDWAAVAAGKEPAARTREELAHISALAQRAAGLDEKRGDLIEVASAQFAAPAMEAEPAAAPRWKAPWWWYAAGGAVLIVLLLLIARLTRRRPVQEFPSLPLSIGEVEAALPPKAELVFGPRERSNEQARLDAPKAAKVLSAWLSDAGAEKAEAR